MKRTELSRFIRGGIAFLALVAALSGFAVFAGSGGADPALGIDYHNLSYSAYTYAMYAVSYDGIDPDQTPVSLLFWDGPRTDGYEKGTELYSSAVRGYTTIGGRRYAVFYSDGIAPKKLVDAQYCRAYAETPKGAVYSEVCKYSPLKYLIDLARMETASQADVDICAALRGYGAAAQVRFNYKTDGLATDEFCYISLDGAVFDDGIAYGLFRKGATVRVRDTSDAALSRLIDESGETVCVGKEADLTVTGDMALRSVPAEALDAGALEGRTFTAADTLLVPCFYTASPMTVEARLRLPKSYSGRGGVVLGSYGTSKDVINLEVYNGGKIRLFFAFEGSSASYSLLFDTDIRGSEPRDVAVTIPEKGGLCKLYVDGVFAEEQEMPCDIPVSGDRMMLGGDHRSGNSQYFKGRIYSLAVYLGERSAPQIAADALCGPELASKDLLNAYIFDEATSTEDAGAYGWDLTDEITGLAPEAISDRYSLTDTFDSVPLTYEAIIDTDADVSNNKGCTIIGNYNDVYVPGVTFRVYLDGRPSLCLRYDREHQDQFTVPVNILGKGRVHVAFSIDNEYVYGYLNGELKLKKAHAGYLPELTPYPFSVGGDNRTDNTWWFRDGGIYTLDLFSAYRSAEQIKRDVSGVDASDPALMLSFNFESSRAERSGSGNALMPYFYDKEPIDPSAYDYTIACVGDTQSVVKENPDKLHCIYDYILEKADEMKIDRVIGLGDITEDNTDDQWELTSQQIFRLDGVLPYTVVRGNHDLVARTPEAADTRTLMFGRYFDNEIYARQYDGCYDGAPANVYKRFEVCGVPYLLLCLDYGPDDDVLDWAGSVVDAYPQDNVIISTHAFLFHDGTTLDSSDICPPSKGVGFNDCDVMWDRFVSKHANIILVVCGHDPSNDIVVAKMTGDAGNTVTCFLIDPQHTDRYLQPTGLVAFLHFSDGGRRITVEYYSTIQEKYYKTSNEITVTGVDVLSYR